MTARPPAAALAQLRQRPAADRRRGPGRAVRGVSVVVPADHLRPLRQGPDVIRDARAADCASAEAISGSSGCAETAAIGAHKFVATLGENDLGVSVANQGYDGYRHWKIAIHSHAYNVVLLTLVPDRLENGCYPLGGGRDHKRKDVAVIRLCRDSGNPQQGNQRRRQKKSHHVPALQRRPGGSLTWINRPSINPCQTPAGRQTGLPLLVQEQSSFLDRGYWGG